MTVELTARRTANGRFFQLADGRVHAVLLIQQDGARLREAPKQPTEQAVDRVSTTPVRSDWLQLHRVADEDHPPTAGERQQGVEHAGSVGFVQQDVVVQSGAGDVLQHQGIDSGKDDVSVAQIGIGRGVKRPRIARDAIEKAYARDAI